MERERERRGKNQHGSRRVWNQQFPLCGRGLYRLERAWGTGGRLLGAGKVPDIGLGGEYVVCACQRKMH